MFIAALSNSSQRMLSRAVRPLVTGSRYFHTSSTIFAQQLQSADDFKNKVLKSTKPVVVDYYAEYFLITHIFHNLIFTHIKQSVGVDHVLN